MKKITQKELNEISKEHEAFLADCGECVELENLDLSGLDLSDMNFSHADFENIDLRGANLINTNFHRVYLGTVNLEGAIYKDGWKITKINEGEK